jgi:hypothetical protein
VGVKPISSASLHRHRFYICTVNFAMNGVASSSTRAISMSLLHLRRKLRHQWCHLVSHPTTVRCSIAMGKKHDSKTSSSSVEKEQPNRVPLPIEMAQLMYEKWMLCR